MNFPGGELFRRAGGHLSGRVMPSDLAAILVFVAFADVVLLAPGIPLPIRAAFALPLLFFLPGYAIVTALFPARAGGATGDYRSTEGVLGRRSRRRSRQSTDGGGNDLRPPANSSVTVPERVALGFAASLAVLPVVALVLSETGIGFTLRGEVAALSFVTLGGTLVGWGRRLRLPEDRRFEFPAREGVSSLRRGIARASPLGAAATVALALAGLVAASTLAYALVVPAPDTGYTEQSLLTEAEDGRLVAGDYPSEMTTGETSEVVAAIENQEGETVSYTLVAHLQRVRDDGEELRVIESHPVDRRSLTVEDRERETATLSITPEMEGEDLRLVVFLYRGSPPEDPDASSAYRYTFVWIDVDDGTARLKAPGADDGSSSRRVSG